MSYKILKKENLNEQIFLMEIEAPAVAKKAKAGQFIILRMSEKDERVPFTIADFDAEKGSVTIIVQAVGKSTLALSEMEAGEDILDFVGPLGNPTPLDNLKKVAVIGGGLGTAIAYPQAKALKDRGAEVTAITGFRSEDYIILDKQMEAVSDRLIITTDDGSNGLKGFVTDRLKELLEAGERFDEVIAIGPLMMMRAVCEVTRPYGIHTTVSMNPVMIDGTGMCGGCRVIVGGQTKFACVDGPDFDGHLIDWETAINRQKMFGAQERAARKNHTCRMGGTQNA